MTSNKVWGAVYIGAALACMWVSTQKTGSIDDGMVLLAIITPGFLAFWNKDKRLEREAKRARGE